MVGGTRERFRPWSWRARRKQLLHLTRPDKSLVSETVERLVPLVPAECIYIDTS